MSRAHYIIHRVNLLLEAPDMTTAQKVQEDTVRVFNHWVLPKLEQLLDQLVPKDIAIRLDSLDLDLPRLDTTAFDEDFGEALLRGFEQQIERIVAAAPQQQAKEEHEPFTAMSMEERGFATFLFFLETGRLPWWSEQHPAVLQEDVLREVTENVVLSRPDAAKQLFSLLEADDTALERLLLQFSSGFLQHLILLRLRSSGITATEGVDAIAEAAAGLGASQQRTGGEQRPAPLSGTDSQQEFLQRLIQRLTGNTGSDNEMSPAWLTRQMKEIIQQLRHAERKRLAHPPGPLQVKPVIQPDETEADYDQAISPRKRLEDEGGMYIEHAGLVLLHPFLEYFFKEFHLIHDTTFTDEPARTLAVHLLQYLASGRENPPEYLLTFEKFLCGADLFPPLPRFVPLNESMRAESDRLLRAAIGHWQALKNTSPAGLREGFLQRPGKLIPGSFQNRLIVERKAHDVLLSYLPWGYGIIKLPWLKEPLFVDWIV